MHVHLSAENGQTTLLLDGVDVTRSVMAEGFSITPHPLLPGQFRVAMTVRAERLTVDADAVVQAAIAEAADLAANTDSKEPIHG